ncbi:MAG: hypothetical protein IOD03_07505 [Methylocystis sp.]|nr:hypothetical protein [Rhodobacter sp.]MCA3583520.1 hypothetical protein [Methylocystis sp.]MCA3461539.1 hypothetical protein [Rhodobacter sp.]MCA3464465.1 hypothetical protein [Rhodobacter sp.]MCA3466274.1 hypothetical protein [Rhodobacter sp.]
MAELIETDLVKALVNLEARTPRLQAAVQRAEEACTDLAIEAASAGTDDARRAIRTREAALATDLENARATLAGHLVAVEGAKARLEEARQSAAADAEAAVQAEWTARAREIAHLAAEHPDDLDEAIDLVAVCFKRVQEHNAKLYAHIAPSLDGPARNELASGLSADAVLRRVKLRAALQNLPLTGHILDASVAPLPKAAAPLFAEPSIAALLDLHDGDDRDGRQVRHGRKAASGGA